MAFLMFFAVWISKSTVLGVRLGPFGATLGCGHGTSHPIAILERPGGNAGVSNGPICFLFLDILWDFMDILWTFYGDLMDILWDFMGFYGHFMGFFGHFMGFFGHFMGFYGHFMGFYGHFMGFYGILW